MRTIPTMKQLEFENNQKANRNYYQKALGVDSLRKSQWDSIQKLLIDYGYQNERGYVNTHNLDTIARIKKIAGQKFVPNEQLFKNYISRIFKIETDLKKQYPNKVACNIVKMKAREICLEFQGYDPEDSTVYGWFRRSNIPYKGIATIEAEKACEIIIRAMLSNPKYSRKAKKDDVIDAVVV